MCAAELTIAPSWINPGAKPVALEFDRVLLFATVFERP